MKGMEGEEGGAKPGSGSGMGLSRSPSTCALNRHLRSAVHGIPDGLQLHSFS